MAGTYSQIYIQLVFVVKGRQCLIHHSWEADLYKYMSGIISRKGQRPIIINGMPDHVHVFFGLRPSLSVSELARDLKNNSSKFINQSGFIKKRFSWQTGYGAFSYSKSHVSRVYDYIKNQKEYHLKKDLKKEYIEFLKEYEINFQEKYLFD